MVVRKERYNSNFVTILCFFYGTRLFGETDYDMAKLIAETLIFLNEILEYDKKRKTKTLVIHTRIRINIVRIQKDEFYNIF